MKAVETIESVVSAQLHPEVADVNFSVGDTLNIHYRMGFKLSAISLRPEDPSLQAED